ncbi:decaprenyl-phosphate phosphoribosyltransferase [Candidatus Woesearchaeota archaeon]|nr:decaprenyl-phosphate phosphoribosyltransferase [Candidatus Woesearchaeota archaeon]
MNQIKNIVKLLRPAQWYKNLLVFVPIVFSGNLANLHLLLLTFVGFLALCAVSSANYVINDLIDIKSDRRHPEKKKRPLASRKIKIWQAVVLTIVLLIIAVGVSAGLDINFFYAVAFMFGFSLLYSLLLKREAFLDIIAIGVLFVVRAVAGVFIIGVETSPWLIACVFFLALFLLAGKRHSDAAFLGKDAKKHRSTLKMYTPTITNALMVITTALLVVSYSLYSFLGSDTPYLIFSLPFALYLIFRYFALVYMGSPVARHPERVFLDLRMDFAMVLWAIVILVMLYFL